MTNISLFQGRKRATIATAPPPLKKSKKDKPARKLRFETLILCSPSVLLLYWSQLISLFCQEIHAMEEDDDDVKPSLKFTPMEILQLKPTSVVASEPHPTEKKKKKKLKKAFPSRPTSVVIPENFEIGNALFVIN